MLFLAPQFCVKRGIAMAHAIRSGCLSWIGRFLPKQRIAIRRGAFVRNRDGFAAVEFAMIVPLMFGMLFGIIETGTLFVRATAIDAGIEEAKRLTMTGQIAAVPGGGAEKIAAFKAAFCAQTSWIVDCNEVHFDVRAFTVFGANMMPNPIQNGVFNPGSLAFDPGQPCQIVVVRAYYIYTGMSSFMYNYVSNLGGGKFLMTGSAAFRNEPFGTC